MDVEAQNSAEAITIYMAVTGKGEAAYSREKDRSKWERAAIAASDMRRKHPHSAVKTLSKIGEVAACFGGDWPDVPGEPEILRRVKWAARQLQAARALPASMEPVGYLIDWPDEPDLGHYFAEGASTTGRSQPLHTAAQVLAMGRVPPGWQAVPVEPTTEMVEAAAEAHMPFGDMALAIQSAIAAAPQPPAAPATTGAQPPTTGAGSATAGAAPAYRLLQRDIDTIQADDEFLRDDAVTWQADPQGIFVGMAYMSNVLRPARRAIESGQEIK